MNINLALFNAQPKRAKSLKATVDSRLLDSIIYLSSIVNNISEQDALEPLKDIIQLKKCGLPFRGYPYILHDALIAAVRNNKIDDCKSLLEKLNSYASYIPNKLVVTLSDRFLNQDIAQAYAEIIDNDDNFVLKVGPVSNADYFKSHQNLEIALQHLHKANLELHHEVLIYIQEIVLVRCLDDDVTFDSGSNFNCYSTTFINALSQQSWMFYVESLVHEAAHMHLFAINLNDQLVKNHNSERFSAPLRKDQRPMSGIYHANFVIARIINAFNDIRHQCILNGTEESYIIQLIYDYKKRFFSSLDLIKNQGRLTPLATAILENSESYIRGVRL